MTRCEVRSLSCWSPDAIRWATVRSSQTNRVKAQVRRGVYFGLRRAGLVALQRRRLIRTGRGWATILVFHTLSERYPHDGITMSPSLFAQISGMLREQYSVLSLSELVRRVNDQRGFTGREVVITFDDGYLDNYAFAAPILSEHGLPALFYLTAGFVGTHRQFAWDTAKGRTTEMMTWDHAREMHRLGFEIGCHTWSHADLGTEPVSSAQRELGDARARIEDELGASVSHFAYPFGGPHNIRTDWIDAIREAGFASNVSCHGGFVDSATDVHLIPRVGCHQHTITDVQLEIDRPW